MRSWKSRGRCASMNICCRSIFFYFCGSTSLHSHLACRTAVHSGLQCCNLSPVRPSLLLAAGAFIANQTLATPIRVHVLALSPNTDKPNAMAYPN